MPNRILKESILDSPTLARLDEFVQDQFPRLLLLVDDWGCFNADPETIKGRAYSKRKKVTPKVVKNTLGAFADGGMLFMWAEGDRVYGYWVAWDTHNFCNGAAVDDDGKQAKHRRKTPEPPWDQVIQYVEDHKNVLEQVRTDALYPIPIPIPIPIPPSGNKYKHGEHGNVLLTDAEHTKLVEAFGAEGAKARIADADVYLPNAKKYASHYAAILTWERIEQKKQAGKKASVARDYDVRPVVKHTSHTCGMCPDPHRWPCEDEDCTSDFDAVACPKYRASLKTRTAVGASP